MLGGPDPAATEGEGEEKEPETSTADDFRFVRTAWETPTVSVGSAHRTWFPFAKGGSYSPFYADVFLAVNWTKDGAEVRFLGDPTGIKPSSRPQSVQFYFRPGLTWPLRTTSGLALRAMPAGCAFGHKGPAAFVESDAAEQLLSLLALATSQPFRGLVSLQLAAADTAARSYEVGVIQRNVLPSSTDPRLADLARRAWTAKRGPDTANLTSHAFEAPALVRPGDTLATGITAWSALLAESADNLLAVRAKIDAIAYDLYGIGDEDRRVIEAMLGGAVTAATHSEGEEEEPETSTADGLRLVAGLLDYALGAAFGRWDIRYATGERQPPPLPDPFAALPVCPPGMFQNAEGLPMEEDEGRRMKDEGKYPLRVSWDGILVDDEERRNKEGDSEDIVARVREAIGVIWKDRAPAIEQEACEILGVKSLRDYFRKPGAFFADHLTRYSKSRRQAPIYWPLSTASGSYTLWIYYHRLTNDTLYKCLQQFVEPKMKEVEQEIHRLRTMLGSDEGGTKERDRLAEQETFLNELKEMHAELSHWAPRWKPNLNDGVQITASPLWKLFRLPKWRKTLEATWQKLETGDYDWAHLAYSLLARAGGESLRKGPLHRHRPWPRTPL
jgi:hypothetical protein